MKVLIVMDSFKGSLSSIEAGNAVRDGIKKGAPEVVPEVFAVADGGEGTVHAFMTGMGGHLVSARVTDPLNNTISCEYGIIEEKKTAVIEMAGAAGLGLVPPEKRNPMYTTTFGVGEVILDALHRGCRKFIIGIGGSATNDGGAGMLQALGIHLLTKDGCEIGKGAEGLNNLEKIDISGILPEVKKSEFLIACDVKNPLCGKNGCTYIFAPQKGGKETDLENMDRWLSNYADLAKETNPLADKKKPGAGAAGGLGFAFQTFLNSRLVSGIELMIQETKLEEKIQTADLVITGEGCLDGQTAMGKAPVGIAALAKKYQKPVFALAGSIGDAAAQCLEKGIDAYFPVIQGICGEKEAMEPEQAKANIKNTAEQLFRVLRCKY